MVDSSSGGGRVVVLCGGVGGAKLADGLQRCLEPALLTAVVNTADDFEHYGLHISPDVDTVLYTLAGRANAITGWGIADDSDTVMRAVSLLGEDTWFHLGDRDLATHLVRTAWLGSGSRPTEVSRRLTRRFGVPVDVLPMCDESVRTVVRTSMGEVPFQTWFVRQRCTPSAEAVRYDGIESARPTHEVQRALDTASVILIGPSNPYLSIGPILALAGVRDALRRASAPIVAVSPIVAGRAFKGPAAAMMARIAGEASATAIARLYVDFLDGILIDNADVRSAPEIERLGVRVHVTDTHMPDGEACCRVAHAAHTFARNLGAA